MRECNQVKRDDFTARTRGREAGREALRGPGLEQTARTGVSSHGSSSSSMQYTLLAFLGLELQLVFA